MPFKEGDKAWVHSGWIGKKMPEIDISKLVLVESYVKVTIIACQKRSY